LMQRWIAFFWLVGIAGLYAIGGFWLSLVCDGLRRLFTGGKLIASAGDRPSRGSVSRRSAGAGDPEATRTTSPAWLLVLIASAAVAALACRLHIAPVWRIWLAGAALAAGGLVYWAGALRSADDWRRIKVWRADRKQAYLHLALLTGTAIFAAPFFWMVSTSLKLEKQVFTNPPVWIPHPVIWSNYPRTFLFLEKALPVGTYDGLLFLGNTLTIVSLSLVGTLLSSSMVAYSFARLRWPGRDLCFYALLATMMIPGAVTMIPVFLIFRWLGWIDTLRPLWVPAFFGGAFSVFLLRQFFLGLPNELEDAARIDGCSYWTTYWRILLPQIRPALAALAILQFMGAWNDFMGPLIYITSPQHLTGSYALQLFQSAHGGEWTLLMCAATLWTLPVIILFFFTQRQFIEGITLTGIKG